MPLFPLKKAAIFMAAFCISISGAASLRALEINKLECEARSAPLGLDVPHPRLGWTCASSVRGDKPTAYRILVASSASLLAQDTGDIWDSGKVVSTAQSNVPYAGPALPTGRQVFWKVRVWDATDVASAWSAPSSWTLGVMNAADWQAQWIGQTSPPTGSTDAPGLLVRRAFNVDSGLKRAVIFVSGLGSYTLTVNGSRVTPDLLEPGWTDYTKTVLYQTYDITSQLQAGGANAVGLSLGHGVYRISAAPSGRYVKPELSGKSFGPLKAIAQIRLEYADGTSQTIATDQNWQVGVSPVTFDNLYAGEDYDARLETAGWDRAGATLDSTWQAAVIVSGPGGTLKGVTHAAPPVRIQQVLQPASVRTLSSTVTVYDLGQNASIMPSLVVSGPAGSGVRVIPSELLASDGTVDRASCTQSPGGSAWWQYTLKGTGTETWSPQFFTHGSRYLQVQLIPAQSGGALPAVQSLTANVIRSDSPVAGGFQTSSTLFNNIWQLVRWAQCNNMMSVMTDCPHRERMPWLGDNELNNRALRYNFDLRPLLSKAGDDMADAQYANGFVPNIAPEFFKTSASLTDAFHNSPEWGGAVVIIPWQQYQFDGDLDALATRYQAMKDYVAFLASTASGNIISTGLGDWYDTGPNPPWGSQLTPVSLTATAHYFYFNRILAQVAALLGNTTDAMFYTQQAESIRASFNATFFNATTGSYSTGSQTANALPLELGMPDSQYRAGLLDAVIADIRNHGNALTSGIVGHPYLLRALAEAGRSDVLFAIYSQSDKPGYGMQLARGATALTEKWDASVGSFGSQDHYMQGPINEWFFHDLAGIQPDPTAPGFKKIIIKPALVGDLTWVQASYDSVLGPISSRWQLVSGTQLALNINIPPGAGGTIYVPTLGTGDGILAIRESGTTIWQNGAATGAGTGLTLDHREGSTALDSYIAWSVGSGTYQFTVDVLPAPSGLAAAAGNGQVALGWTAAAGAESYTVKRTTRSGGPYVTLASGLTSTTYADNTVINGTTYYYVVASATAGGASASAEVAATPQAAVLSNTGFETPGVSTYQYNPSGGAWTFAASSGANGSGITANTSAFTSGNPNAPEGAQVAFLQGASTISQPFSGLTPGLSYRISFSAAQRVGYVHGGQTWSVKMDGATVDGFAPGASATAYADYSATFVASAPSQVISFVGTNTNGGDNTVFLDNVRVTTIGAQTGTGGSWGNNVAVTGAAALDGNLSTYFDAPLASGAWVGLDFGAPLRVIEVRYAPRASFSSRMVGGKIQGSNTADFSSGVVDLCTISTAPTQGVLTTQAVNNPAGFRHVRYLGPSNGYCNLAEFQVTTQPGSPATPAGLTATAGSGQVALGWNSATGATSYNIKRSTTTGGPYDLVGITVGTAYMDTTVTNGVVYDYVVSAGNSSGESADSPVVTALPLTAYEQWKASHGLASSLAATATPDNDGMPILLKYATGMTPGIPSPASPATLSGASPALVLQFNRLSPAPVTYAVEASADLANWTVIATLNAGADTWSGPAGVSETGSGGIRTTTVTDVVTAASGTRRFLRLRVYLSP